jgi:hypothetical protein
MDKTQLPAGAKVQEIRQQSGPLATIALHKVFPQLRKIGLFVLSRIAPVQSRV